jgi:hypothetical protein
MPTRSPCVEPPAPSAWVGVAVLALHLLLLWGLHETTHKPTPRAPRPTRAVSVTLVTEAVADPAAAPGPASPPAAPRRPRAAQTHAAPSSPPSVDPPPHAVDLSPPAAGPAAQTAHTVQPEADQPLAAAPPASSPLLDSAASRHAIRALARQRPITEQAALASATTLPAPGAQLGERIREAGKGDCAKGQYFGAGMGLLSLPFLAAAAIRDQCAQ